MTAKKELAELAKLTSLIKEKTTSSFVADRKCLKDFYMEEDKNELLVCGLMIRRHK